MPGGNTGLARLGFAIFFSALSTSGLVNDVAILGFHDNWLYSSSWDRTWNKYIAINETTRPRPQCLEAEAITVEAKASLTSLTVTDESTDWMQNYLYVVQVPTDLCECLIYDIWSIQLSSTKIRSTNHFFVWRGTNKIRIIWQQWLWMHLRLVYWCSSFNSILQCICLTVCFNITATYVKELFIIPFISILIFSFLYSLYYLSPSVSCCILVVEFCKYKVKYWRRQTDGHNI